MFKQHRKLAVKLMAFAAVLACLPYIFAGQQEQKQQMPEKQFATDAPQSAAPDIEAILSGKADFIPANKSALEQLTAVAQHYKIPMGIEWVKQKDSQELNIALPSQESGPTVRALLEAIVSRLAGYQLSVKDGVVHVAQPAFAADADNFLNVQIEDFRVRNENLFDAEEKLRLAIDMTLRPEEYEDGYMGGYGYAPDDPFAKRNINFKGVDLTVREILDGIVKSSGNALWIAELDLGQSKTTIKPSSVKEAGNAKSDGVKSKYRWKFVPLVGRVERQGNQSSAQ